MIMMGNYHDADKLRMCGKCLYRTDQTNSVNYDYEVVDLHIHKCVTRWAHHQSV